MVAEEPLTAAEIYEQITGGKGTQSLSAAQDGANDLTNRMVERAQRISALRAKTMSGWRGRAGDAAADATLPLVQAAADDAVHLQNARAAVGAQMDAFGTAKHSVKPVPTQPPELGIDDVRNVLAGRGWDSYTSKVAGWQADSQGNIDAFSAYHSASTDNGGRMPAQYAQLADSGAAVSMTDHAKPGPTDTGEWARDTRVPAQDRQTVQDHVTTQGTQQDTNQPGQTANRPPSQGRGQVPAPFQPPTPVSHADSTHANSYVPPPAAQGGYVFGPTGGTGSGWSGNASFSGDFGPGTGGGYFTGTGIGAGPETDARPGSGSGTGAGPGTETGPGPGTGRGTGNRPGVTPPGTRTPGSSTGARFPEERLPGANPARPTAGSRGTNVAPMGTPVGGRKDEDREKKRAAYLQNPDPDETFGGFTEKPMPPVIGEKKK